MRMSVMQGIGSTEYTPDRNSHAELYARSEERKWQRFLDSLAALRSEIVARRKENDESAWNYMRDREL